ncbi:PDZ domain-containing protein [Alkalimarinus sediminis]|uniref:PDZ domain-containing protein n=1 Tax=Alkalimarinus sediminis TaxID=1632866 RepID=A0A9E8KQW1_9ALTE|nr:PDZ domain-containing protein [Alkalimarinus sediminis]UZW76309.1 PDZ domain-containing protein [Alkalimarinus sediminis]
MNIIMTFYKVLMAYPTFELPWFGFSYRNLTVKEHHLLADNKQYSKGVAIKYIWPNSIASNSGLIKDDIIMSVNGYTFDNNYDLDKFIFKTGANKEAEIVAFRGGQIIKTTITSEVRPRWAAP